MRLTRVFGVFGTNIFVACIQNVLVHERCSRRHLPEERYLHRVSDLDPLSFLHEDLARVFTPIFAV